MAKPTRAPIPSPASAKSKTFTKLTTPAFGKGKPAPAKLAPPTSKKAPPPPAKPVAKMPAKKAPPPPAKPVAKLPAKPVAKVTAKKAPPPPAKPAAKAPAKKAAPPPAKPTARAATPAKASAAQVERASAPVVHTPAWPDAAPAPAAAPAAAPVARRAPAQLTAAHEELLHDLGTGFTRALDRSVETILEEARELETAVAGKADRLLSHTRLTQEVLASLGGRSDILVAAETAWTARFNAQLPAAMRPILDEATTFKRDAIAALRYFCEDDADVQRRVDAIAASDGVVALAHDLMLLADLVQANGATLKHAELPARTASHARELSEVLTSEATDDAKSAAATKALELRNRAFWHLREVMDAIRAAGRYAFRAEPAALLVYRAAPVRAPARTRHADAAE